ncbi:MAG: FKBP-type peptidyl-prolyl cis-trans isomerase [Bacteroidia bacterium]
MNKTTMLLSSALLVGLASCNKSEFDGYTKAENGLHYKFYSHDENGVTPKEGDGISFKYVFRLKSNDSIFVTSADRSQDGSGVTSFVMPKSSFIGSIEDAMMMMAKNDSASFIISADSFFLKTSREQTLPPFVKPNDKIQVDIKMVDIKSKKELEDNQKKQEAEMAAMQDAEKPKLDAYLAENKITTAPTASGLIFIETQKGKGKDHPKASDVVTVHYTGTLLDGTKFDSSLDRGEPTTFPLNQVIPGWTEAIQLMTKGSKAKLIIPSALGYGPRGGGPIPPFSTLVFDVELIDFKAGSAQPGM